MKMTAPMLRGVRYTPDASRTAYPYSLPLLAGGLELEFTKNITIICGENGSGKSTLLEILAAGCGFNAEGGNSNHIYSTNARVDVRAVADTFRFKWLPKTSRGFFFRAESFFNYASYLEDLADEFSKALVYGPYGGTSLHEQSHGESFLALFSQRLGGKGVYIFDEPEAALSPMRQIAFLSALKSLLSSGEAQVIMATHSPILMSYPDSQFLEVKDGELVPSHYQATEHYTTTRRFMENPAFYLDEI